MYNVVLSRSDCIESILPAVEMAMAAGDVCRLQNLADLGQFETVSEKLLAMVEALLETLPCSRVHPGFRLLCVDERGVTRTLLM